MIKFKSDKSRLLIGASTLFTAFGASGAMAASVNVEPSFNGVTTTYISNVSAFQSVSSTPTNTGAAEAAINAALGGITRIGDSTGSSDAVTANIIAASAMGNSFTNPLSASLLDTNVTVDGLGLLGVANNSGTITSRVTNSALVVALTDVTTGSATNSSNAISATTMVNDGRSTVTGDIPNGYVSTSPVSTSMELSDFPMSSRAVQSQASIAVVSVQNNDDGASSAATQDNTVSLSLASTASQDVTASASLEDNSISAVFAGNKATSTVSLSGGENPQLDGNVSIANAQQSGGNTLTENALSAGNTISASVAGDGGDTVVNTLLDSSLSVTGNAITAAATANESLDNGIALLGGLNVSSVGSAIGYAQVAGNDLYLDSTAGLSVMSGQRLLDESGTSIMSRNADSAITATAQNLESSSIDLSGNAILSTARGNNYSSAIETVDPVNSVNSSVAAVAAQSTSVDITATTANSAIRAGAGDSGLLGSVTGISGGTVSLTGNTSSASAYANQLAQSVALEGTTLTPGSGLARYGNGTVFAVSEQSMEADVTASNTLSLMNTVSVGTVSVDGGSLLSGANRQEAVALGNLADNAISLNGTNVGSGVAVKTGQSSNLNANVDALLSANNLVITNGDVGQGGASTVSLVDNLQRAVAYAASSENDLTLDATVVTMNADSNEAIDMFGEPIAGYVVSNRQSSQGTVSAITAAGIDGLGALDVSIGGQLHGGSSVLNDGNTVLAAAYATSASNIADLDIGSLSINASGVGGGYAPVGAVRNQQFTGGAIEARVTSGTSALVSTSVAGDVEAGSSVSTSGNTLQAQALGNNTIANNLSVASTSVEVYNMLVNSEVGTVSSSGGIANTAFTVSNWQDANGVVTAALRNVSDGAARVETRIADQISSASVVSEDNVALARATSSQASNMLDIAATTLRATGSLVNVQTGSSETTAQIGTQGTAAVPGTPGANYVSGGSGTYDSASYNALSGELTIVSEGSVAIDISTTPAGEARDALTALLTDAGFTVVGTTATADSPGVYDLSFFDTFSQTGGSTGTIAFSGFSTAGTPGSAGVPALGGVTIAVGDAITSSTVRVADNTSIGSAIGNSATNAVNVASTSIAADGNNNSAGISPGLLTADYILGNRQSQDGSTTSEVYGTFAIDQEAGHAIAGSSIDVSGNAQSSTSVSNVGVNTLTIDGNDMVSAPSSAILSSDQSSSGQVNVDSGVIVYAPAASTDSSITLNDNSNSALGVINDVSNRMMVSATNLGSGTGENAVAGVSADNMLVNAQTSLGVLNSTATTDISNQDIDVATSGLQTGSLSINGNATLADASANRAINSASVDGAASNGATTSLSNQQDSLTNVSATAASTVRVTLAGTFDELVPTDLAALDQGSVSVNGNTSTSLARGNSATNTLTSTAAANYVPLNLASTPGTTGTMTDAAAVVLNNQGNAGNVSAMSNSATYAVALNNTGGSAVNAGSVSVARNRIDATAYGNTASNTLGMTALNTGHATGAVNNMQNNSGVISATVTSVSFAINTSGATTGGSFAAGSNAITATAVGNNAVSTIGTIGR